VEPGESLKNVRDSPKNIRDEIEKIRFDQKFSARAGE
jgi:hypothetical protein